MQSTLVEELADSLAYVGFLDSHRLHRPPSTFHRLPFYHWVQILCQSISNDSILMLASATDAKVSIGSNHYHICIDCLQLFQLPSVPGLNKMHVWQICKDARIVHESFRNESSNLRFLALQIESTIQIFGKKFYESNPWCESFEKRSAKQIRNKNL
jgi:hypothetical protein